VDPESVTIDDSFTRNGGGPGSCRSIVPEPVKRITSTPRRKTAGRDVALPRDVLGRYVRRVLQSPASEASPAWIRPAGSWASSPANRQTMQNCRSRDTAPEKELRSACHRLGLRFRVCSPPLSGLRRRADLIFPSRRVAVYMDGCFWHGCAVHFVTPKTNADYWGPKIAGNVRRDRETDAYLEAAGWRVLRVWEHDDMRAAALGVAELVRGHQSAEPVAEADQPAGGDVGAQKACLASDRVGVDRSDRIEAHVHDGIEHEAVLRPPLACGVEPGSVELVCDQNELERFAPVFEPRVGFEIHSELLLPVGADAPFR
jgi:DNA mismatch endonuclease, patch repair protein